MTDNNKHLVRVGHEFAAAMSDDTPIITIAKMVTELASALDVQSARSEALAAENAALKSAGCELLGEACAVYAKLNKLIDPEIGDFVDGQTLHEFQFLLDTGTTNTDAWVNEQRAVAYNDLCAAFVMHRTTAGLDDSDKVTVKEATDALLHCAAQLRGSQV